MICPRCGYNSPDGINNCVKCGAIFNNGNVDYQQMYYRQKVERKENFQNGVKDFGDSVSQGFTNMGNSINQGFQSVGGEFNKASNAVQNRYQQYQTSSEMNKKGDDAYVMGLVAMILSFFGGSIISLVLGCVARSWAKKAFAETRLHKHEQAKTFALVAIIISSITTGIAVIGGIISIIITIVGLTAESGILENFDMFFSVFM